MFKRYELAYISYLTYRGFKTGRITPFSEDLYAQMQQKCFAGFPAGFHIKYLKLSRPPGKCYDRSLMMFLCFDDALLVRGRVATIAARVGWKDAGHGWIERGDYVYDPTSLWRYERKLYYAINRPRDVAKINRAGWEERVGDDGYGELWHHPEDYFPDNFRSNDLVLLVPLLRSIPEYAEKPGFTQDLEAWLNFVRYDETAARFDAEREAHEATWRMFAHSS